MTIPLVHHVVPLHLHHLLHVLSHVLLHLLLLALDLQVLQDPPIKVEVEVQEKAVLQKEKAIVLPQGEEPLAAIHQTKEEGVVLLEEKHHLEKEVQLHKQLHFT